MNQATFKLLIVGLLIIGYLNMKKKFKIYGSVVHTLNKLKTELICFLNPFTEFLHLTSSSSGLTATFEQNKGTPMWQKDLSSPVVAVFLLGSEGLLSVPFQTVSDEVLQEINERAESGNFDDMKLL